MRRTPLRVVSVLAATGLLQACGTAAPGAGHPAVAAASAAAQQATAKLVDLAAPSRTSGMPPRETDPAVKQLLDTIVDTSALRRDTLTLGDFKAVSAWGTAVSKVVAIYGFAGTGLDVINNPGDIAKSPMAAIQSNRNVEKFAPEFGRVIDADTIIMTSTMKLVALVRQANHGTFPTEQAQQGFVTLQGGMSKYLKGELASLQLPGVTDSWRRDRMPALQEFAPVVAPLLPPWEASTVHQRALDVAECQGAPDIRAALDRIAALFPDIDDGEPAGTLAAHAKLIDKVCTVESAAAKFRGLIGPALASGTLPRQTDPTVGPLLDIILDTSHQGEVRRFDDLAPLAMWLLAANDVLAAYGLSGTDVSYFSESNPALKDPQVLGRMGRNIAQYPPEVGRALDAELHLVGLISAQLTERFGTDSQKIADPEKRALYENLRDQLGKSLTFILTGFVQPGIVPDNWRLDRLTAFEAFAPQAVAIIKQTDAAAVHYLALQKSKADPNPQARSRLQHIAAIFATR